MKNLTVNRLALGNLKHRRKQYTIMIISILLAMLFSSSVVFFAFSMKASMQEKAESSVGRQTGIVSLRADNLDVIEEMKNNGGIIDYGAAHLIGFGYTDEEEYGVAIGWLDEKGEKISYRQVEQGVLPDSDGEIAVEQNVLVKLGLETAKIGDVIKLNFKVQNDFDYLSKETVKEYKLTAILKDKRKKIIGDGSSPDRVEYKNYVPGAFVAPNTKVDSGGKERMAFYYVEPDTTNIFGNYDEEKNEAQQALFWAPLNKLGEWGDNVYELNRSGADYYYYDDARDISSALNYSIFIGVVLLLASCIAIVNAFNTNLKDRKRQIGLLRAVGATKRQIIKIFGREALLISLICTPLSVLISYLIVLIASRFFGEYFVLDSSLWVLFVCAAVNLVIVMISAFIPLLIASKITPMQAIRNTSYSRKMKKKRIKSQKQFNTAKLLSKRYGTFSKGSTVALSIILTATIFVSCAGFSLAAQSADTLGITNVDYSFEGLDDGSYNNYYSFKPKGLTNSERNEIAALPYVSESFAFKKAGVNLLIDNYNDYFKTLNCDAFPMWDITDENGLESLETYQKALQTTKKSYRNIKESLGYARDIFPTTVVSTDNDVIEEIAKKNKLENEVNMAELSQGCAVILVAPKRAALFKQYKKGRHYGTVMSIATNDKNIEKAKNDKYYDENLMIADGECPYKVGDEITLSRVVVADDVDEETVSSSVEYTKTERKVKIAAIIEDNARLAISRDGSDRIPVYSEFSILTTNEGIDKLFSDSLYTDLDINLSVPVTQEIDNDIMEELSKFSEKHDAYVRSSYQWLQVQKKDNLNMIMILLALTVIAFAVCGSIVNSSLTAKIREGKREIGTLRAVGASEKELVASYVRRLLSTFAWGSGIGFGSYTVFHIIAMLLFGGADKTNDFKTFFPWATAGLLLILFAICSFSLWSKIRKEMKNSIVENIREL